MSPSLRDRLRRRLRIDVTLCRCAEPARCIHCIDRDELQGLLGGWMPLEEATAPEVIGKATRVAADDEGRSLLWNPCRTCSCARLNHPFVTIAGQDPRYPTWERGACVTVGCTCQRFLPTPAAAELAADLRASLAPREGATAEGVTHVLSGHRS